MLSKTSEESKLGQETRGSILNLPKLLCSLDYKQL